MKRLFAFAGLVAAAAISLTNCQVKEALENIPAPVAGQTLTVTATTDAGTKTANDGMHTLWSESDELAVFYSTEAGKYESVGKVTLSDGAGTSTATFTLTGAPSLPESADWYVIYPYYEFKDSNDQIYNQLITPAASAKGDGWMYIGDYKNGLEQAGFDNMANLAGSRMPMFGKTSGGAGSLAVSMKHIASAIEFNVTNSTGSDLVVKSISIKASESIVGCFFIDVTSEPFGFVNNSETSTSSESVVKLTDAQLVPGASGKVYMPVKPYTQGSAPIEVLLDCSQGGVDKTVSFTLAAGTKFNPGKIKKVNLNVTKLDEILPDTVSDALSGEVGKSYSIPRAVILSAVNGYLFVSDGTGTVLVYNSNNTYTKGQVISFTGKTKAFNNLVEFDKPEITDLGETETLLLEPDKWTDEIMAGAYGNAAVEYVTYECTLATASNGIIPGSNAVLYLYKASGVSTSKDKRYRLTGFVYGWTDYVKDEVTTPEVCMYVENAAEISDSGEFVTTIDLATTSKTITVGETLDLEARTNVTATISFESDHPEYATVSDNGIVTGIAPGTAKITVSVAANPGVWTEKTRNVNITVIEKPSEQGGSWVETDLSAITGSDEFVIVGSGYAMTNTNGTGSAPAAVEVSVSGGQITSSVTDNLVWTLSGNASDGYTIYPKGVTDKWLYCNTSAATGSNNNMRVGTGARSVFELTVKDGNTYLTTKDDKVVRFVCVYNNADWRGYIEGSINSGNKNLTDTKFYKKQ